MHNNITNHPYHKIRVNAIKVAKENPIFFTTKFLNRFQKFVCNHGYSKLSSKSILNHKQNQKLTHELSHELSNKLSQKLSNKLNQ